MPVIMLAGGNAGPDIGYTVPVALDRVLADFPKLKVAVAHGGWPWVHQVLHIAFRRPNLYLSPDMYLVNMPGMNDYLKAADGFLAERFIYGSSFPLCPAKGYLDWFNTLPINRKTKSASCPATRSNSSTCRPKHGCIFPRRRQIARMERVSR